jgi:hypothetical protein
MSFGQKILEKYGFKEGSGLGKNSNGITEPIKANFKVNFQLSRLFIFYCIRKIVFSSITQA